MLLPHSLSRPLWVVAAVASLALPAAAERDPIRLTHGPMLGHLTDRSVRVWGRTSDPGPFEVHYGTSAEHLDSVSKPAVTAIERDNTGVAVLEDLRPDTRYHYQLWVNGRPHGLPGSFRTLPSYFTFDDHELVNDIWGSGEAGKRHRRTVFRDIGTQAWFDYLGWANPTEFDHPIHCGQAAMTTGSDLLVDPETDFTKLPLTEMTNLHVHWGTAQAGINDMRYDDDAGDLNSYVYDIAEVVDAHTLRLHMSAKVDSKVTYSIGRRSYGKFRVSNCEFFLIDTRGDRDMHDVQNRSQPKPSLQRPG